MARLTKRLVDAASAGIRETWLWDDELPGFGLRVFPSGVKAYVIQYRAKGRTRRLSLGAHGTLTTEEARDRARRHLSSVRDGADPSEARHKMREADTVEQLAARYREHHMLARKKPSSIRNDEIILKNRILPALGKRKVVDVTRADVQRLHHGMKDSPYQANRTLSLFSKMMNLAESWGIRPDGTNPCRHVERYQEKKRHCILSAQELASLGKVLRQVERESVEWPTVVPALRLALFTGARIGEILGLRWEYVNSERGVLELPDSKTGAKLVHLNAPAVEVLHGIERQDGNPFVIYGRATGAPLVNMKDPWGRIRKRAGMPELRIHDLRHSFASMGAGLNASLPVIGALLGHTQPSTTARYAHLAADPLKDAAERIGSRIAAQMKPASDQVTNVVKLKRVGS